MSILKQAKLNISLKLRHILPAQPCVLCGSMNRHGLWCQACDATLPYLDQLHCPICAQPTPRAEICGHCLENPPRYERTVALFAYRYPIDRLVQAMKYHEQLALAQIFADKLAKQIERLPDFIVPMPLHPAKLQTRGFNQAQLIAAPIARALDLPLLSRACHRLRDTPSQTSLPWKARGENVKGAFGCDADFANKHIALVDDVMTTGTSMNELAAVIQGCGASEISAWVVARTVKGDI